jgi:signal transduction histidine kinase
VKISVEGDDPARLSVRDHGPGLSMEEQEHLFEAYDISSESDHHETLGLGLFIARQIIEEHGGKLRVVSTAGMGTLYVVELPRSAPVIKTPWQRRTELFGSRPVFS